MPEQLAFAVRGAEKVQKDASPNKPARRGSIGDAVQRRKYIRRPKPDMHAPKRPLSAYINFSKDQRNKYERHNWSFSTLAKQIGEDWRDLDLQKKNRYLEDAANDKLSYDQAMRRYKSTAAYSNYKRYVQEFNRRHNSSQAAEQGSSPDQSPSPSHQGDEAADGNSGTSDYYNLSPSHASALFSEHSRNGSEATHPPGTINPASLDDAMPSPPGVGRSAGMQPEYGVPEFMNPMVYPVEPFGSQGFNVSMLRPTDAHSLHAFHLDASLPYDKGPPTMQTADMMGFHHMSTSGDEVPYQQPVNDWTNAYMGTA